MNVWYTFSTIFNRRRVLQLAGLLTLCVAFITMLFLGISANAAPGVNQTISFQGRLLTPQGQPVADGYYNIQFKIYQDGSGDAAGNPNGTLEWTETRINNGGNNGVFVKNGYMSVDLGSQTPFGNNVDWNQDTLWLSMNIAGSSTLCSTFGTAPCLADGEMLPMKRLTSTPYALNAGKLGGISSDGFIHNGTGQQTGDFNISGTGTANILQGSSGVIAPLLDRADAGTLSIGTTNATTIEIGSASGGSSTSLQGGTGGVAVQTGGAFSVLDSTAQTLLNIDQSGAVTIAGSTTIDDDLSVSGDIIALSADESELASISWLEGNSTARFTSTGDTLALQGSGVDLLTAKNATGKATIGIGNAASNGYALDVTGEINASTTYKINGVDVLGSNDIAFSGAAGSGISSSDSDGLRLFSNDGIKIGDSTATGDPTLLTLDKGAAAPGATGDAVLGSMYYDTTLGKVQCYEADGWGSCSSSPDNFVTLSPEYSNAVTSENENGTFASGFCSDALDLNDGNASPEVCGLNETYNYYSWTSAGDQEMKDIFVTYQLPGNFTGFVEGSTSLLAKVNDEMAGARYQVYKNTSSGLVACGSSVPYNTLGTWDKLTATSSSDPANCGFTANDSLVFKISLESSLSLSGDAYAYVSTLSFAFSDQ